MSEKKCCVPGCIESGGSHRVLHLFPNPKKERERFNAWLMAIGGDVLGLENDYIYRRRRVCHAHFEDKYCCRLDRISNIAVPTQRMPDPLRLSKTSFFLKERRPLTLTQQLSECLPSTSRDTVLDVALQAVGKENILTNTMGCSKKSEQILIHSDTVLDVAMQAVGKENIPTNTMGHIKKSEQILIHSDTVLDVAMQAVGKENIPTNTMGRNTKSEQKLMCKDRKKKQGMTMVEQELYHKLVRLRVKLSKLKNKMKAQSATLKAARNITSSEKFRKIMEDLPCAARLLTMMQFREKKKKDKGRRFTLDEKILSLAIFKQSAKSYRFLRKMLILPAPQTLVKLLQQANVQPGISKKVFAQLKKKAEKMKIEDRLCVLLFDEMALKANIQYNERKDKIIGFVTDGLQTTSDFADHAQVFMLRGLMKNFKQPISYTFSSAATKGPELAKQIKCNLTEVQKTGLIVVATICDQGTNNRSAINILVQETKAYLLRKGEEIRENEIILNDQKIVPLYDPPHLLKCIRNNLLTKDLKFEMKGESKTAKWEHLEMLHKENPGYKGMRLIPKMTDNHIVPNKIVKMKVKYAAQVFSQTVAKTMGYLADKGILPPECRDTADALAFFDQLFDSVNGSFGKGRKIFGKPLLGPVSPKSIHHTFWGEAKKTLSCMRFIEKNGKTDKSVSLNNWAWTLDGIQNLLKTLKINYNINSVWMRHLNQDPLENFFGAIRSQGCRNINPSPEKFESAYATLLVNNLTSVHAPGRNCEKDFCETLHALVITDDCKDSVPTSIIEIPNINLIPIEIKNKPQIIAPLQYVSGYFLREAKKKVFKNCQKCKEDLFCTSEVEFIKCREYAGRNWLCSPSYSLVKCISEFQDIYNEIHKSNLKINNIKQFIKTLIFVNIDFQFINCETHKETLIDFLINLSSRFFIHHYCKNINKILSGKRDCDDDEDTNQLKAKKMFLKCFKRK